MSCIENLEIIDKPFKQYERETVERCYLIEIERHEGHFSFSDCEVMHLMDNFHEVITSRVKGSILLSVNATIAISKHKYKASYFVICQGRSEGDFTWIVNVVDSVYVKSIEVEKCETWAHREFFNMKRKLCECEGVISQHLFVECDK